MTTDLFGPVMMKSVELQTCFVLAAAASGAAADATGTLVPPEVVRLSRYAENKVGLIITGAIGISRTALSHPQATIIENQDHIAGFRRLCDEVHTRGGKIAAQLCHSGLWTGRHARSLGTEAIAPSRIENSDYTRRLGFVDNYHAASESEIQKVITDYGASAARAVDAGFDAVEVHGAHDSLLAQFLSPLTNHRDDDWGGPVKNRARLHQEIGKEIRMQVDRDFPVMVKLGCCDGIPGGLGFEEGREVARMCRSAGFDILEVSQGLQGSKFSEMALRSPIQTIDQEGFTRDWCRAIKNDGATTIMTGGIRSIELATEVVAAGETDFIGLCRPLICEPGLISRWGGGDRQKSACTSCNRCAIEISKGFSLDCYKDKKDEES